MSIDKMSGTLDQLGIRSLQRFSDLDGPSVYADPIEVTDDDGEPAAFAAPALNREPEPEATSGRSASPCKE